MAVIPFPSAPQTPEAPASEQHRPATIVPLHACEPESLQEAVRTLSGALDDARQELFRRGVELALEGALGAELDALPEGSTYCFGYDDLTRGGDPRLTGLVELLQHLDAYLGTLPPPSSDEKEPT